MLLFGCNSNNDDKITRKKALFIANNLDSSSLELLRNYSYGRRGPIEFWSRDIEGTTLYTCSYRSLGDSEELTLISRPFGFIIDFPTTFQFDTSYYYQYKFFQVHDSVVRLVRTDFDNLISFKDSVIATKQMFPIQDPFERLSKLNSLKERFGFMGVWYRGDIGDFINFWLTPYDKLVYMPDTNKLNPKFKRVWIDEFLSGKKIKDHWRLVKVNAAN